MSLHPFRVLDNVSLFFCLTLTTLFLSTPVIAQVPTDFDIMAYSGGLAPFQDHTSILIKADGSGSYARYRPDALGEPFLEDNQFQLTAAQMDGLWQAILDNDFFNLPPEHFDDTITEGTFARIIIKANNITRSVRTQNIAVPLFDAVANAINAATPTGNDLLYDTLPRLVIVLREICPAPIQPFSAAQLHPPSPGYTKRDLLTLRGQTASQLSSLSPSITQANFTPFDEEHPGTTVSHRTSLRDAAERGLVTLEGKGDFFGDQVSLSVDNTAPPLSKGTVDVTLYIEFWGAEANFTNAVFIQNAIESIWGGETNSAGQQVSVRVNILLPPDAIFPNGTPGYHQIELAEFQQSDPNAFSYVKWGGDSGVNRGIASGRWDSEASSQVYAHEAGHLLGLADCYLDFYKEPDGTWRREDDPLISGTSEQLAHEVINDNLLPDRYSHVTESLLVDILNDPNETRFVVPLDKSDIMCDDAGQPKTRDIDAITADPGLMVEVRDGDILTNKDPANQNFSITRSRDVFVPPSGNKTLNGIYVACIDSEKGVPSSTNGFDVAPSLADWGGIDTSHLQSLLQFIDENELYCETDWPSQFAIWRISDDLDFSFDTATTELLLDAGLDLGDTEIRFPHLRNPNANNPDTSVVDLDIWGDLDKDLDVDRADLTILRSDLGRTAATNDPYDIDNDGRISVLDMRKLILLCTRPRCSVN